MTRDEIIRMAQEIAAHYSNAEHRRTWTYDSMVQHLMELLDSCTEDERQKYKLTIERLNAELDRVYGLLALAHLNIKQHLEYGFDEKTARSTLISVGRYSPRLKAEMEKNHD